jgi:hypothetical protein
MIADSPTEQGAYALLVLGEHDEAERRLAAAFAPDDHRAFVEDQRRRRSEVLRVLCSSGPDEAKAVLRTWRDHTARAVRVK